MRLQDATKIWFKRRQASFCLAHCEIDQYRAWSLEFFFNFKLRFSRFCRKNIHLSIFSRPLSVFVFCEVFDVLFMLFFQCTTHIFWCPGFWSWFFFKVSSLAFKASSKLLQLLVHLLVLSTKFFLCWRGAQLWKAKIVSVSLVFRYHFYVIPFCWFTRKIMSEKASSPFSLAFSPVNCKVLFKELTELRQNSQYHAMSLSCWCSSFLMFWPLAWNQFSRFPHSTPSLLFSEFCTFFRWFDVVSCPQHFETCCPTGVLLFWCSVIRVVRCQHNCPT